MPTSAGECSRCSTLTLELERMQSQRDDHERAARALQKKVHAQAHGLSTAAATIAQLQEQLATQAAALRVSDADNERLSAELSELEWASEGRETGLQERVAELEQHLEDCTAQLAATGGELQNTLVALRVLHPELEESERSLGGAARFWADCYAQVAPPADAPGYAGLYASYDGEGGGSGGGLSSARRLMSGDVVGRRGGPSTLGEGRRRAPGGRASGRARLDVLHQRGLDTLRGR